MWTSFFNRPRLGSVLIINVIVPILFAMAAGTWFGLRTVEQVVEARLQEALKGGQRKVEYEKIRGRRVYSYPGNVRELQNIIEPKLSVSDF
ncbi:MAG: hypothetical protein ACOC8R_00525 [Desulfosalsimonas sp.]